MSEKIEFTVPLVPPSVNHYKVRFRNGNTVVSKEAEAFKYGVRHFCRGSYVTGKSFYVSILVTLGKGDRGDVDNFPKLVLDGCADAGVFRDKNGKLMSDAHVTYLEVVLDRKARPELGWTTIKVSPIAA